MATYKKVRYSGLYQSVIIGGYDVRSGAYSIVEPNIKTKLDESGQYVSTAISGNLPEIINNNTSLEQVSAMSDISQNENQIAENLFSHIPHIKHDEYLGYYSDLYAGYVKEGDFRINASSGGITTWLLKELLANKCIDGVIHIKKSEGDGKLFEYGISRSVDEIKAGAKTRYYPAEFSQAINEIKLQNGRYAIVGIPSLIMEARLLAKHDKTLNKKLKYMIGLICGHQKSTKYAEWLAWQSGIKPGSLIDIDFRKKIPGTTANAYATEMTGIINGKKVTIVKKQTELFGSHWGHGFFKSQFSDYTDDAFNETADITIGDAWLPQYVKDHRGTNVLIIRNPEIQKIILDGLKKDKLHLDKLSLEEVLKSQSGLIHQYRDDLPYRLHKKDMSNKWRPNKRLDASNDIPYLRRKIQDIRENITEQSHIRYSEAVKLQNPEHFKKHMRPLLRKYRLVYGLFILNSKGAKVMFKKIINNLRK